MILGFKRVKELCHDTDQNSCLVPGPHICARTMRFGSRDPRKFRIRSSDTSPKCIDREGLEGRRTGTRRRARQPKFKEREPPPN